MSTKDNWDDSSDDEEEVAVPPCDGKYDEAQFVEDPKEAELECEGASEADPQDEFVDAKASEEEHYEEEEYYSDEDYEDELDDYDKKLGRYVSCR